MPLLLWNQLIHLKDLIDNPCKAIQLGSTDLFVASISRMRRLRERALAGEKRAIALQQKILEQAAAAAPDHDSTFEYIEALRGLAEAFSESSDIA